MITEQQLQSTKIRNETPRVPMPDPPRGRLSPVRVMLFVLILAGLAVGGALVARHRSGAGAGARRAAPWFAPYVDVTLTPTYPFQSPSADPVSSVFLGFVVSRSAAAPCTPSWGGYYTLAGAQTALDLDERIAQLRAQGGSPMISFGGQANTELAVDCTNAAALQAAYLAPVRRYDAAAIDLDVEGASLADVAADARRAQAIAAVQRQRARAGSRLGVWLTLPVSDQGLTAAGVAAVRAMLAAHVTLSGVDAMAMDYGPGQGAAHGMFPVIRSSLFAVHAQLQAIYEAAGTTLSTAAAWRHLGVTVMIGQNDVPGERFTLNDARRLTAFVAAQDIPRVSAWSLNRDSQCGSVFSQVGVVSDTCSGVAQSPLQFTNILSRLAGTNVAQTSSPAAAVPAVQSSAPDNPATSPYPIWQATAAYDAGYKVVWHREIYQAKWWTQGTAPDAGTADNGSTAWLLIGPVPAGATAPRPILLASGHHPQWSPGAVYQAGAIVTYDGLPFQAKWYTQGDQPTTALPASSQLPWAPLYTLPGEPSAGTQ
jgi:chitinase